MYGVFGAGVAYTFVRKTGKQGERRTCNSRMLSGIFSVYSDGNHVSACIGAKPESVYQIVMLLFGRNATGGVTAFNHKGIHQGTCKREISVFDYSGGYLAALLGFVFCNRYRLSKVIGYDI